MFIGRSTHKILIHKLRYATAAWALPFQIFTFDVNYNIYVWID